MVETSAQTRFATASHHAGDEKRWKMAMLTRSMRTGGTAVGSDADVKCEQGNASRKMETYLGY